MSNWLAPRKINEMASEPRNRMRLPEPLTIDPERPWVPEHHTQLYYTPVYASLHREHRLRYNQLFALRLNEYVMLLEAELIERVLTPLLSHRNVRGDRDLTAAIATMIDEERHHYRCFLALNRACRPDLYPPPRERLFSQTPFWAQVTLRLTSLLTRQLAFVLWYLMAMEDSSVAMAREMARAPETETLGPLDPGFALVHAEHMKDEARHVHIDGLLIDLCIGGTSARRRRLNAALFRLMLRGLTRTSRNGPGARVIRQLVADMPELQSREDEMMTAMLRLNNDRDYEKSLFNRQLMPMAFAVFDGCPELSTLGERLPGYDRQ